MKYNRNHYASREKVPGDNLFLKEPLLALAWEWSTPSFIFQGCHLTPRLVLCDRSVVVEHEVIKLIHCTMGQAGSKLVLVGATALALYNSRHFLRGRQIYFSKKHSDLLLHEVADFLQDDYFLEPVSGWLRILCFIAECLCLNHAGAFVQLTSSRNRNTLQQAGTRS